MIEVRNHCPHLFLAKADEFYCWRSDGRKCIASTARCDYRIDCLLGEDEETCGEITEKLLFTKSFCISMSIS